VLQDVRADVRQKRRVRLPSVDRDLGTARRQRPVGQCLELLVERRDETGGAVLDGRRGDGSLSSRGRPYRDGLAHGRAYLSAVANRGPRGLSPRSIVSGERPGIGCGP
jgi:tRNA A37 methylthiotransferase MiaB